MIESIIQLFMDEAFRHWFFWFMVIFGIFVGFPTLVRINRNKHAVNIIYTCGYCKKKGRMK